MGDLKASKQCENFICRPRLSRTSPPQSDLSIGNGTGERQYRPGLDRGFRLSSLRSSVILQAEYVAAALDMESAVRDAVAEHSLNPQNIEAAIRKALLPRLFSLTGLDKAKIITERIVEITRIGIARGGHA